MKGNTNNRFLFFFLKDKYAEFKNDIEVDSLADIKSEILNDL